MEIKKSEFTISAPRVSMCPKDNKTEYAFIGRSNVGKSSLINMLTKNSKLCKTSSTPGRTRLINYFQINSDIANQINFNVFDTDKVGVYGDKEWKQKALLNETIIQEFEKAVIRNKRMD